MSDHISKIIPTLVFIVCLHPIYTITTQSYFGCKNNKLTFYTNITKVSIFVIKIHNKFKHCSILLVFGIRYFHLLNTIACSQLDFFIRDRFKSIARGLGAPGYFSFFGIFSICILEQSNLINSRTCYFLVVYVYYFNNIH